MDKKLNSGEENIKSLYIHFLDFYHFRRGLLNNNSRSELLSESRDALRISLLLRDIIYLPVSSFFEGPLCEKLISEVQEFVRYGNILLIAGEESLAEHVDKKKVMYSHKEDLFYYVYRTFQETSPAYRQKHGSSTKYITDAWLKPLYEDNLHKYLDPFGLQKFKKDLWKTWERVPEELGEDAFILDNVEKILEKSNIEGVSKKKLESIIEGTYSFQYANALDAALMDELVFLYSHYDSEYLGEKVHYRRIMQTFSYSGIWEYIKSFDSDKLYKLSIFHEFKVIRDRIEQGEVSKEFKNELIEIMLEFDKTLRNQKRMIAENSPDEIINSTEIGIICALPKEIYAIEKALDIVIDNDFSVDNDKQRYILGNIATKNTVESDINIVATCLSRMGTGSASFTVSNMNRSFPNIKLYILVGIAAGIPFPNNPDKHVRLGDIIVSDREGVIPYTDLKLSDNDSNVRNYLPPPSASATRAVNEIEIDILRSQNHLSNEIEYVKKGFKDFIRPSVESDVIYDELGNIVEHPFQKKRYQNEPIVHRGAIGSADVLMKSSRQRDELLEKHSLIGLEMEGKGVAEAAWQIDGSYIIVKGVCDYGDESKVDMWQEYATIIAASYTRLLLKNLKL